MKCSIDVDIADCGNPMRGYHDYRGTIRFDYRGQGDYIAEKEREIIDSIVGTVWMWCDIRNTDPHVWSVHYGYDSGD